MYWSPNYLAVVFKKQEISQQVVTRMQDLTSGFSKNFPGVMPPDPHSGRGRPPPAPNTQPGLRSGAGSKHTGVGTQTLVPSTFQPWLRPCGRVWTISCLLTRSRTLDLSTVSPVRACYDARRPMPRKQYFWRIFPSLDL